MPADKLEFLTPDEHRLVRALKIAQVTAVREAFVDVCGLIFCICVCVGVAMLLGLPVWALVLAGAVGSATGAGMGSP